MKKKVRIGWVPISVDGEIYASLFLTDGDKMDRFLSMIDSRYTKKHPVFVEIPQEAR